MCFSSTKSPAAQAAPAISAPPPTVLPTSVSEVSSQDTARKQRIAQLRYGFASTIKNSGGASGILSPTDQQGKKTLG